jgi:uncharacterized protein (TIGR02266 family)
MEDIQARFRQFLFLDRKRTADGLTPDELRRWTKLKRLLNQEFSPGTSYERVDRRESVRVPTRLEVGFHDRRELGACLMTNLSRGGVFVSTGSPAEIGTRLELRLSIEDGGEEIVIAAEVVSVNARPDVATPQRGMGMRFLEMKPEVKRLVDELYESQLREAARRVAPAAGAEPPRH